MKLKFLGAGASEGIPAIFCHCALCERARRTGRLFTRSQLLVDDVLLIDFPPDSYDTSIAMGVELADIRNILVTHSHSDHFYADDFFMRGLASSHGLKVPVLKIYANRAVTALLDRCRGGYPAGTYRHISMDEVHGYKEYPQSTEYVNVRPFQKFRVDGYEVTALPANHIPSEECLIFAVSDGDKSFLYATDTSMPSEETFAFLKRGGYRFDAVICDATYGTLPVSEGHMNFRDLVVVRERLIRDGVIGEHTLNLATHVSHNAVESLDALEHSLPEGFELACDGKELWL